MLHIVENAFFKGHLIDTRKELNLSKYMLDYLCAPNDSKVVYFVMTFLGSTLDSILWPTWEKALSPSPCPGEAGGGGRVEKKGACLIQGPSGGMVVSIEVLMRLC